MAGAPRRVYDQAYFDRWYRARATRVKHDDDVRRKVAMTVATAEYHLGHRLRSVIDIGCGEGAWRGYLRELRPGLRYQGYDASEWAVRRYGRARQLRLLRFDQLAQARPRAPADLLVCTDVMAYVPTAELLVGLREFARLCDGVAMLDVFAREDEFVGDREGYIARSARWYRRRFAEAGWTPCGSHCYLGARLASRAATLEVLR